MEFFQKAKVVRLRSHHEKYLFAEENEESVTQDRDGIAKAARWTVESVPWSPNLTRLKSTYGKYLTASKKPFLLGATGRKVVLSNPSCLDSSHSWEPIRDGPNGSLVKLKSHDGNYLRGNSGLPPWRNSVTTDVPHRSTSHDILWHVDVLEILTDQDHSSDSRSNRFSRQNSSSLSRFVPKYVGRVIYYQVTNCDGEVEDESINSISFKGNDIKELYKRLREESNNNDLIICKRSPVDGKLFPLHLNLPPGSAGMTVFLVPRSSKIVEEFNKSERFCWLK